MAKLVKEKIGRMVSMLCDDEMDCYEDYAVMHGWVDEELIVLSVNPKTPEWFFDIIELECYAQPWEVPYHLWTMGIGGRLLQKMHRG